MSSAEMATVPKVSLKPFLKEIQQRYPGARVEPKGTLVYRKTPTEWKSIALLGLTDKGAARFRVGQQEVYLGYTAKIWAPVPKRRIRPKEILKEEDFEARQVDLAMGQPHQIRGLLLRSGDKIAGLQARQTLMPGRFVIRSAVETVPDVNKGDTLNVDLRSGTLVLSTMAVAQEDGRLGKKVRVITKKNKREFVGVVKQGKRVEVSL